jgi:hypothetical protein
VDKENTQIAPTICLSQRDVHILAGDVPFLNEAEVGAIEEDFLDLFGPNMVFPSPVSRLCQVTR